MSQVDAVHEQDAVNSISDKSNINKIDPPAGQAPRVAGKKAPVRNRRGNAVVRFRSLAERSTDTPKQHVIYRHAGSEEALTTARRTVAASCSEIERVLTLTVLVDADCVFKHTGGSQRGIAE